MKKFITFGLIGFSGVGINFVILYFMTEAIGLHYLVSNIFAISLAFLWNYYWNRRLLWSKS